MTRLKDIAANAGVSVMTVSKALRDAPDVSAATKTRIKLIAQQLGYVPDSSAQGLRTRTTKLLGIALPSCADPAFSSTVLAVEQTAYEAGYDVVLAHTLSIPEREDACIRRFLARRVDGILIVPAPRISSGPTLLNEVAAREIPTVVLGPAENVPSQFHTVECDEPAASGAITNHLLQLGHRSIAYLAGPQQTASSLRRFQGYRRALREAGLEIDDKCVFQAGRSIEDGVKAARQFLQENCRATAVQAANDLVAVGAMQVFAEAGMRIPGELSIAGFGNVPLSDHVTVPLTTVDNPKHRLGIAAVHALQQLLKGKSPDASNLPCELMVRASTGTARASS